MQKQWRLRVEYRSRQFHNQLLKNEFTSQESLRQQRDHRLRALLEHCYDSVLYYRNQFLERGIRRKHLRDGTILHELPVLAKSDVVAAGDQLRAQQPMQGQSFAGHTRTSGSTGEPVVVVHSNLSFSMFTWLKQRELRWFRWRPRGSLLSIRPAVELSPQDEGESLPNGAVQNLANWPLLGDLFETGRAWGFSHTNSIDAQVELLNSLQPDYLLMQAAGLEHLSLQALDATARSRLSGALAISQTLTPAMRDQVESAMGIPVAQNYGLNEIGLVASRCPEVGRYHVHSEHCLVEIVDEQGQVCTPGETGRLLVTGLNNSLMPLLRYDADDMAEVAADPCPCGRQLPSFDAIIGRYRRTAYLPEGTFQRWGAIQLSLGRFARANPGSIRQYQAVQDDQGDFLLCIDCAEETLQALTADLRKAFVEAVAGATHPKLTLKASAQFIGAGQRKFQNFISAFTPEADR